jgi:hypothetical protein
MKIHFLLLALVAVVALSQHNVDARLHDPAIRRMTERNLLDELLQRRMEALEEMEGEQDSLQDGFDESRRLGGRWKPTRDHPWRDDTPPPSSDAQRPQRPNYLKPSQCLHDYDCAPSYECKKSCKPVGVDTRTGRWTMECFKQCKRRRSRIINHNRRI